MPDQDGFVRVWLSLDGKRTSISVDDTLFAALVRSEGGRDEAMRWLRDAALEAESARLSSDSPGSLKTAGLSRLVQRVAIQHLLP